MDDALHLRSMSKYVGRAILGRKRLKELIVFEERKILINWGIDSITKVPSKAHALGKGKGVRLAGTAFQTYQYLRVEGRKKHSFVNISMMTFTLTTRKDPSMPKCTKMIRNTTDIKNDNL
uniref:Uncharacterized protein n=1 Tax=Romanomermis culicivorax TaxID=13658 RepID=A0A915K7M8_ROMCU